MAFVKNSNHININSLRGKIEKGAMRLGPSIKSSEYQREIIDQIIRMTLNLLDILNGIFNYFEVVEKNNEKFPESREIIHKLEKVIDKYRNENINLDKVEDR